MSELVLTLAVNAAVFTLLFGIMMLVRKVFTKKLSAMMLYVLWTVVVLKLIIPFGFESSLSPFNLFAAADPPTAMRQSAPNMQQAEPSNYIVPNAVPGAYTGNALPASNNNANKINQVSISTGAAVPSASAAPWTVWAFIAWGAGTLGTGLWLALSARQLRRRLYHARVDTPQRILKVFEACKDELGITRKVGILVQNAVPVPAVMGIFHPILVLPGDLNTENEEKVRHICMHELMHLRNGDLKVIFILNLLNAIYWFNPFTWLCFRIIRKDMETVCDHSVVLRLGKEGRQGYICTLLEYSGRTGASMLNAAMSILDGRQKMEKRILAMFKRDRTSMGGKITAVIVAVAMVVCGALTACQPTPKYTSPAVNVQSGESLRQALDTPDKWVDKFQNQNKIYFDADAAIELPEVEKIPVAEVSPVTFTQAQVNKIVQTLLPGCPLYKPQGRTLKELTMAILETTDRLEMAQEGTTYVGQPDDLKSELAELQKEYDSKTDPPAKVPTDTTLGNFEVLQENYFGLDAMGDSSWGSMELRVICGKDSSTVSLFRHKEILDNTISGGMEKPEGVNISREDALQQAAKIAKALDRGMDAADTCVGVLSRTGEPSDDYVMSIEGAEPPAKEKSSVWRFVFTRTVNGCPTTYDSKWIGQDAPANIGQSAGIPYEQMTICINDKGLAAFEWTSPMKVDKIETESATLLSFAEAEKAAKEALTNDPRLLRECGYTDFTIDKARLGLMRVSVKDKPGTYKMLPVWDFYETSRAGGEFNLATINALDGSVIDRNLGY